MRSGGGAAEAERLPTGSGALHSTQKEVWKVNILFFPFLLENILFLYFLKLFLLNCRLKTSNIVTSYIKQRHGEDDERAPWRKAEVCVTGMEPSWGMDSSSSVVMESRSLLTRWRRELSGRFRKSSSLSVRRSLSTGGVKAPSRNSIQSRERIHQRSQTLPRNFTTQQQESVTWNDPVQFESGPATQTS